MNSSSLLQLAAIYILKEIKRSVSHTPVNHVVLILGVEANIINTRSPSKCDAFPSETIAIHSCYAVLIFVLMKGNLLLTGT